MAEGLTVRVANGAELDAATLYALLRLRSAVFVVEQECAYLDLDGRDLEPATRHLWLERSGEPVAYLRLVPEPGDARPGNAQAGDAEPGDTDPRKPGGTVRLGRVVVAPAERRAGLARRLVDAALARLGDADCVLASQSYLVDFYAGFGFTVTGPEFDDHGIPHVPMRRPASRASRRASDPHSVG